MKTISVYDPPLCCSTGVCGADVDPKLVQFASDLTWLGRQGVKIERYNLAQQPGAFVANPEVGNVLAKQGTDCLPIVSVNGEIVTKAIYPTREQLASLAGVKADEAQCCGESAPEKSGCCGSESGDCC